MAIPDLLWACPVCGLDRGLRGGADATCSRCGTAFDRVRGARIRARRPGGEGEEIRTAAEWVDRLPDPERLLATTGPGRPVRAATVAARFVERDQVVKAGGRYVNRIEIFGPEQQGTLELALERLSCRPEGGEALAWEFSALKAIQASSRSLQIRGEPHPLASFAFLDDSSFLWEQLLAAALADFYRRTGRGEIAELQPKIVTR